MLGLRQLVEDLPQAGQRPVVSPPGSYLPQRAGDLPHHHQRTPDADEGDERGNGRRSGNDHRGHADRATQGHGGQSHEQDEERLGRPQGALAYADQVVAW